MDKITWINGQAGGTPLSAENLNQMEDNIENAIDDVQTYAESIVESGTNVNGKYIKFKDGTMICTKKVTFNSVSVNQSVGSLYQSSALNLGNFAEAFDETPIINCTLGGGYSGWLTKIQNTTASSIGSVEIFRATSSTNLSYIVNVVAYGTYS